MMHAKEQKYPIPLTTPLTVMKSVLAQSSITSLVARFEFKHDTHPTIPVKKYEKVENKKLRN